MDPSKKKPLPYNHDRHLLSVSGSHCLKHNLYKMRAINSAKSGTSLTVKLTQPIFPFSVVGYGINKQMDMLMQYCWLSPKKGDK